LTFITNSESHHRDVVLDADFVSRICGLRDDASTALEQQFTLPVCPSAIDIQQMLSRMWNATIAKLLHLVGIGAVLDQQADLAGLLLRIRDADIELAEGRIVHRTELLRRVCAALARTHDSVGVDDLLNCVSDTARSLGLIRALLPTIRHSAHNLHNSCAAGRPPFIDETVAANTKNQAQLDDTPIASSRAGLSGDLAEPAARRDHPVLSAREVEVIELLAAGASNRRIAKKLVIAEGTVKTHITHILRKLGAANRAEAVSYWLRGPLRRPTVKSCEINDG
jgi:DNA-binding NarL/FixJ family response regulator